MEEIREVSGEPLYTCSGKQGETHCLTPVAVEYCIVPPVGHQQENAHMRMIAWESAACSPNPSSERAPEEGGRGVEALDSVIRHTLECFSSIGSWIRGLASLRPQLTEFLGQGQSEGWPPV